MGGRNGKGLQPLGCNFTTENIFYYKPISDGPAGMLMGALARFFKKKSSATSKEVHLPYAFMH
jgi:hypothetical protein